jgi:hypothetical protein
MKIKKFDHPLYKEFRDKYSVTSNGRIFNGKKELKYFSMSSGGKFVRLFANGKSTSITVGKMILLTFKPETYFEEAIAIHLNGDPTDDSLRNLKFATRHDQSIVHVSKTENWQRISQLGKTYGPENGKKVGKIGAQNLMRWRAEQGSTVRHSPRTIYRIQAMYENGNTPTEIAKKLKISRSSIYNHIR